MTGPAAPAGERLSRRDRLRGAERIDELFEKGAVGKGRWVVARLLANGLGSARVAVAVGRAAGGAVIRNRIRRRLRAAWRQADRPSGWDAVLLARPGAVDAPFAQLREDLAKALGKALAVAGTKA